MKTIMRSISAALLWAFSMAPVQAQGFPTKPVKFIVNYAPGGGTDIMARLLAEAMREDLGQPVIVENRAGAGGALGAAEVARAPADGHTVLVTAAGFLISPAVINSPGYDPVKDFTGVAQIAIVPLLVVTRPDAAATSIQDVIASARRGDKVSFASFGNATPSHLVGLEKRRRRTDVSTPLARTSTADDCGQ